MAATKPLVSIVVPVYNGSNYLRAAIDSALAQDYPNKEILVVNDGSNDNGKSEEIAKSYGDKIRYFSKQNGGVATALNLGINQMKGEYFSWLSHDDVYYPTKISRQITFIQENGPDTIPYADYDIINAAGRIVGECLNPDTPPSYLRPAAIKGMGLHGCAMLIKFTHFRKCGLFNPNLRTTQDYDMWFRLTRYANLVRQPEKLIQSREHLHQGSRTLHTKPEEYWLMRKAIESLTPAELRFSGDAASTYLTLGLFLARSPVRSVAAPVAYNLYLTQANQSISHIPKRFVYKLYHTLRSILSKGSPHPATTTPPIEFHPTLDRPHELDQFNASR